MIYTLEIGAHTDWYSSLMHSGTANIVLEFHGLEYQWAWFCTPGANTDWYPSLVDSSTTLYSTRAQETQVPSGMEFLNTQMPCQMCHGRIENRELEFSELEY